MRILFIYPDHRGSISSSSEFRVKVPWRGINLYTNHIADLAPFELPDMVRQKAEWADALIFERAFYGDNLPLIKELCQKYPNKAKVGTFDDGYPYCTPDMDIYQFWINRLAFYKDTGKPLRLPYDPVKQFAEAVSYFDALFVPNHVLVEDFNKITPSFFVNSFLETEPFLKTKRMRGDDGKFVVGVGAGASHFRSFINSGVLEALGRVMRERPNVEFWIRGAANIIAEARKRMPEKQVIWQVRGIQDGGWQEVLANFDVGLAVLDPRAKFDMRRSPIKIFEHMLSRVPVIASKSPTYSDYYDYGLFCENQTEWYRAFNQVIDHYAEHREAYVQKAYEMATGLDIRYHVQAEYIERLQAILDAKGWEYEKNPPAKTDVLEKLPIKN